MHMNRVFNFAAGPAMLPTPVMERIQEEFLDFQGIGASVIEISHRSKEFEQVLERCDTLLRELTALPDDYEILYVHGGAQMQFSAVPLNLIGRQPAHKAAYVESGNFAQKARKEAARYGDVSVAATSEDSNFNHIPDFDPASLDSDTSYIHITSNNTIFGTRWNRFPDTGDIPLVADMTSEMLSRELDYSRFGIAYAGLQKNLGPSGLAVVLVRKDLLGNALSHTPNLLNYATYAKDHSLTNTNNTFAIYVMSLVLEWLKEQGGVRGIEQVNAQKAQMIYDAIDSSEFYLATAHKEHRSHMNVTFNLADSNLDKQFVEEAEQNGLYALKGHRLVGGIRASIYNAMPLSGCRTLVEFMQDFERRHG